MTTEKATKLGHYHDTRLEACFDIRIAQSLVASRFNSLNRNEHFVSDNY